MWNISFSFHVLFLFYFSISFRNQILDKYGSHANDMLMLMSSDTHIMPKQQFGGYIKGTH